MNLTESFLKNIAEENLFQKHDQLLLAVSGGVDSVVLCELCRQAGFDFVMAHCNFQLRGDDSKRDADFVKELAKKYEVDFYLKTFDTSAEAEKRKQSIETCARELRYEWFYELAGQLRENKQYPVYILTAHHANDNTETLLMNFFRGTGIKGLHGILPRQGALIRPLLFAWKAELYSFAEENKLNFVTDHTNAENEYTRNYFRNELIPSLKKIFPNTENNLLKNIERFSEAEILYNQSVELHKAKLLERKGNEVYIPALKLLKTRPLATVVYEIIKEYGFSALQTEEVISLLQSGSGKYILSFTHRILKDRKWLIISPLLQQEASHFLIEDKDRLLSFAGGTLQVREIDAAGFEIPADPSIACVDAAQIRFPLLLRKWKTGDYFYPLGMKKKKKLGRFFIDQKLSILQKENSWVLEMDKKIIWIAGMRIDDRFKTTASTKKILQISLKKADA